MSFFTLEPRPSLSRQTSSVQAHPRSRIPLKTISNCFLTPDKIPPSPDEYREYKTSQNPFFAKNRKLLHSRNNKNNMDNSGVPSSFKNLLRAKSTVIKQNKFQEFYINREGRRQQQEKRKLLFNDSPDSGLFRSNFPHKRRRVVSISVEKAKKKQDKKDYLKKITAKAITIQSMTEDLVEEVLKEKKESNTFYSKKDCSSGKGRLRNCHKRTKPLIDKENLEFVISPWDNDDDGF